MKELLPLGSIVLLKGAERRIMICGRIQTDVGTNEVFDYSGCLYPEGIIDSKELLVFNNENIDRVFFIGFQDTDEFEFRKFINEKLEQAE
ncbi:MAG: DUF4176 domain-containing protein [Clostridia bacterium]|nr:DUF4176 domain-containing protein [Clostridia bacterium]